MKILYSRAQNHTQFCNEVTQNRPPVNVKRLAQSYCFLQSTLFQDSFPFAVGLPSPKIVRFSSNAGAALFQNGPTMEAVYNVHGSRQNRFFSQQRQEQP